jgi:glutamate-1-semialdehyde 2,1-aminomutase
MVSELPLGKNQYEERTPRSRALFERAKAVEPAGVSYRNRYFEPYPFFVKESKGAKLIDIDGNTYTDYWCTHLAMILGHANPVVMEAIKNQVDLGWHHGVAHELEVTHSETIQRHVPNAELVRYAGSGSEANFFAVRLARTFTKRSKIAKFEGNWHGPYDPLHIATKPPFDKPLSGGLGRGSQEDTVIVPYNDLEGFTQCVKGQSLACVLVEPVLTMGGAIPADVEFLKGLREYCDQTGTLLIFDEVVTGFRLGLSGAQGYFGVKSDLTVLGKIIGGGLPIGAVCGKREVMERMDHTRFSGLEYAYHGGTFSGNALSLAAGLATISVLEKEPVYDRIGRLGEIARQGMNRVFEDTGFEAQAVGVGSLLAIPHTRRKPLRDLAGFANYNHARSKEMFKHLLKKGILILIPEMMHGAVSYAHNEVDIKELIAAVTEYAKADS